MIIEECISQCVQVHRATHELYHTELCGKILCSEIFPVLMTCRPGRQESRAAVYVQALKSAAVDDSTAELIMKQIGGAIAKMHDGGLVHGDLTTSNMLLQETDRKLVLIDFGLAFNSSNPEDKAVDLHVCERALVSAHSDREGLFKIVLEAYKEKSKNHSPVFNRFAEVRMRGRKRTMIG